MILGLSWPKLLNRRREGPESELIRYFRNKVVVHDIPSIIADERFARSADAIYAGQALVVPAKVVYVSADHEATLAGQREYFRSIGIGPQEVRFVPTRAGKTLLEAALGDLAKRGERLENIELSLTGQSEKTQKVFQEEAAKLIGTSPAHKGLASSTYALKSSGGIPTLRSAGSDRGVANNKIFLRSALEKRLGEKGSDPHSLNVDFVPAFVGQDTHDSSWVDAVQHVLGNGTDGSVVVKVANWSSGRLVRQCGSVEDVQSFIDETRNKYPGTQLDFVVEKDLSAERELELSAQFLVERDGKVVFLRGTQNLPVREQAHVGNMAGGMNMGNVIVGNPTLKVNALLAPHVARLTQVAAYYAKLGYRGYLGFDVMALRSGGAKILEVNGRITGASYPLVVYDQLAKRWNFYDTNVYSTYIVPDERGWKKFRNFMELQKILGDVMFDPKRGSGVIPVNISMNPGAIALEIVGEDADQLLSLRNEAIVRLRAA